MTSKVHLFKNAMRVYAAREFWAFIQTFKLAFCIYNKMHLHAEILS